MSIVVTATQGGGTAAGMALRVKVLTGVAAAQGPSAGAGTATQNGAAAHQASITTTVTGSRVYGAIVGGSNTAQTPNAATTIIDDVPDATHNQRYSTCKATAATGTPGATTIGASGPPNDGSVSLLEILPDGTIAEDASGPALASTISATTVISDPFDPPPGALLVAMISSDGGTGVTTMAVSGGGLVWSEAVVSNPSGTDYTGVWIAVAGAIPPDDPVITATQGGATFNGLILRVRILQGAAKAAAQTGTTAIQAGAAAHQAAITTTVTGSIVYGAATNDANTTFAPNASTTQIDDFADPTNNERYGTFRATAATGTPGATTIGDSTPTGAGGAVLAEILPATPGGTITEDALDAPGLASTTSAITVATANFNAPPGSLLVAMVASNSGGVVTMTVSGGGLAWSEKAKSNASGANYQGVWIADVPTAGSVSPAAPGRTWLRRFRHRQQPQPAAAAAVASAVLPAPAVITARRPLARRVQGRFAQPVTATPIAGPWIQAERAAPRRRPRSIIATVPPPTVAAAAVQPAPALVQAERRQPTARARSRIAAGAVVTPVPSAPAWIQVERRQPSGRSRGRIVAGSALSVPTSVFVQAQHRAAATHPRSRIATPLVVAAPAPLQPAPVFVRHAARRPTAVRPRGRITAGVVLAAPAAVQPAPQTVQGGRRQPPKPARGRITLGPPPSPPPTAPAPAPVFIQAERAAPKRSARGVIRPAVTPTTAPAVSQPPVAARRPRSPLRRGRISGPLAPAAPATGPSGVPPWTKASRRPSRAGRPRSRGLSWPLPPGIVAPPPPHGRDAAWRAADPATRWQAGTPVTTRPADPPTLRRTTGTPATRWQARAPTAEPLAGAPEGGGR